MWGTPEQLAGQLRAFVEVGLRYVVLAPVSGLVSRKAAIYGIRATRTIARSLNGKRQRPYPPSVRATIRRRLAGPRDPGFPDRAVRIAAPYRPV